MKRINNLVNILEDSGLKCKFSTENNAKCTKKLCSPIYVESKKIKDTINMSFKITKEDNPIQRFYLNKSDDVVLKKPDIIMEIKDTIVHYGWEGNKQTCDSNKEFNINIKENNNKLNVIFND